MAPNYQPLKRLTKEPEQRSTFVRSNGHIAVRAKRL